jgi:hypothetical protein
VKNKIKIENRMNCMWQERGGEEKLNIREARV